MWYVIRTISGREQDVCIWINTYVDKSLFRRCFIPLYEDVWRKEGIGHITIRKMFSGYLFLETDTPEAVYESLKQSAYLTEILSASEDDGLMFLPIRKDEEIFFDTILSDGLMRVSYIRMGGRGISSVIGPLQSYADYIVRLDIPHRRAIAEVPMLGESKRIKFGLWLDADPKLLWIEEAKRDRASAHIAASNIKIKDETLYGLQIGDHVINTTGIYGDIPLEILDLRRSRNSVVVGVPLFGNITKVEMGVEEVERVE